MTGDEDRNGVVPHRAAYSLGSSGNSPVPENLGQRAVGSYLTVGDLQQQPPHHLTEIAASGSQRRQIRERLLGKIGVQPRGGLTEHGQIVPFHGGFVQRGGKIFLPFQPQTGQRAVVSG